jgi:hypothetical protein
VTFVSSWLSLRRISCRLRRVEQLADKLLIRRLGEQADHDADNQRDEQAPEQGLKAGEGVRGELGELPRVLVRQKQARM